MSWIVWNVRYANSLIGNVEVVDLSSNNRFRQITEATNCYVDNRVSVRVSVRVGRLIPSSWYFGPHVLRILLSATVSTR